MDGPKGVLRAGWEASVGDYAIACGWTCKGALLIVGDVAGGVYAFEGTSGVVRWKHPEIHTGGVLALAVHPNGSLFATAGQDGCVRLWDADNGQVRHTIEVGNSWVEEVAWSSDGDLLAATMSRRVFVYDIEGGERWRSDDHPSTVSAITWAESQEVASACYGRVAFFEASSGAVRQKLEWKGSLVSMVLSPDGDVVACGSQDNSVHFWRRSTGQDSQMHGYPGKPSALAFDSSGTLLATSGGPAVTVWSFRGDGPEGTRPGVLELHVQPITSLAFAHGGRVLASGARDGTVAIWSLGDNGQGEPKGAAVLGNSVAGFAWRPDDRGLAALDGNGGVTVWRV